MAVDVPDFPDLAVPASDAVLEDFTVPASDAVLEPAPELATWYCQSRTRLSCMDSEELPMVEAGAV